MSLLTDLQTALGSHFVGGAWPDVAPWDTPRPYVTFQQVGGVPVNTLCGGDANAENARVQFNVWSDKRLEADDLMAQVGEIVTAAPFRAVNRGGQSSAYNSTAKRYGARQDFSFWLYK